MRHVDLPALRLNADRLQNLRAEFLAEIEDPGSEVLNLLPFPVGSGRLRQSSLLHAVHDKPGEKLVLVPVFLLAPFSLTFATGRPRL